MKDQISRAPYHSFKPVFVSDTGREYAKDLECGISLYAGFCQREQAWAWHVDAGEAVEEGGFAETFEQARYFALKTARALLNGALKELRRG